MLSKGRELVAAALLAALTAVGAQLAIPLPLVPVTLQTLFVYLAGLVLRPSYALLSEAVYLAVGLLGFPVFAGGRSGLSVALSPTFGYLLAFPLAAWIIARTGGQALGSLARIVRACVVGALSILALGVVYLWISTRYILGAPLGIRQAVWAGAVIFLPGETLKVACAVILARRLWPLVETRSH
ncbi:MAG: biotin transporter BioY [candidate division KSB1 bacterium]|nr:biotin transporter BioY [candidate division KSB1 bacterium]